MHEGESEERGFRVRCGFSLPYIFFAHSPTEHTIWRNALT